MTPPGKVGPNRVDSSPHQPQYLTRHLDGTWQPITPIQRERLMGFPDNVYTITPQRPMDDRSRNTMLGNTWHLPTAIWLLFLILNSANGENILDGVQHTNLQKMTHLWNNAAVPWGPPPQPPGHHYMSEMDWTRHLHWARHHHQHGHNSHYLLTQLSIGPSCNNKPVPTSLQFVTTSWMRFETSPKTGLTSPKGGSDLYHPIVNELQPTHDDRPNPSPTSLTPKLQLNITHIQVSFVTNCQSAFR